jgi:hypothetical protein
MISNTSDIISNTSSMISNTSGMISNTSGMVSNPSGMVFNTSGMVSNTSCMISNTSGMISNTSSPTRYFLHQGHDCTSNLTSRTSNNLLFKRITFRPNHFWFKITQLFCNK